MSEEDDKVIKLKGNVVTRTNEQRLTSNVLRLDMLIIRKVQFWKRFLFEQEGEKSSFKLVLRQSMQGVMQGGGLQQQRTRIDDSREPFPCCVP